MKLIRGQSLEAILEKRKAGDPETLAEFGLRRLLDVFLQACQGVEYAHARGVIHRDLKPSNIMVGDFGEVLVMDWGVAKLLERPDPPPSAPSNPKSIPPTGSVPPRRPSHPPQPEVFSIRAGRRGLATQLGTVLGTPAYMAPEQASGGAVDERSDVYSLGVILYEILCGELPFDHDDPEVSLSLQMTEPPMPPSVVNPAAPLALENLALRMLEKKPEDRSLTVARIRAHVLDYIEGFGLDFRRESVWTNLLWFGGTIGLFVFLVWYLTGHSVRSLLVRGQGRQRPGRAAT